MKLPRLSTAFITEQPLIKGVRLRAGRLAERTILKHVRLSVLLILSLPFLFYLVPYVGGFGWSAINKNTPRFPGQAVQPGREPAIPISVETYGTGVVVVGFQARLRAYLRDGDLPLWNPYSGLGTPFAAQGEGSPYFPMAIARSLIPTSWANLVTFTTIAISAVSIYALLRRFGLSEASSAFGGAAWALSGAMTLNLPRNNYIDQFAMIPPLFLTAAWAIQTRRAVACVVFALVVALHAVAGLLQIGVNTLLLLAAFLVFYSYLQAGTLSGRLKTLLTVGLFLALGTALAAPYVLPIAEGLRAAYNKNNPFLAFIPMPSENIVAFFFPLVFGQVFQTWVNGAYPMVVDWNNLYAHGGSGLLLLMLFGLVTLPHDRRDQRFTFLFFVGALFVFHGRFMSYPPVSLISFLPVLNQQSPKHTNGVAVFCLVVAAAFGVEWLRRVEYRRAGWVVALTVLAVASSILTSIGRLGGLKVVETKLATEFLSVTVVILAILLVAFWLARRMPTHGQAATIVTAAVIGEQSLYILLGNPERWLLWTRIGIFGLLVLCGVLAARRLALPAILAGVAAVSVYHWCIVSPTTSGLPHRYELDAPPPYMVWLREAAASEYRAFGIRADYSSVGEIQDIEVIGPIVTNETATFIDIVSPDDVAEYHRKGSTFALIQAVSGVHGYSLTTDYPRARPVLDWMGVRYIVLGRQDFVQAPRLLEQRNDHLPLLDPSSGMRVGYQDDRITVLESPSAQSKALFTTRVRESDTSATISKFQADPTAIDGPVLVDMDLTGRLPVRDDGPTFPVPLTEYRPNGLRASFDAPEPGMFVLKDSPFPGWEATLNGLPAEIVRVNAMVRGVIVPAAGHYEVRMVYRPASFVDGVTVAAATLALLLAILAQALVRGRLRRTRQDLPLVPVGDVGSGVMSALRRS